MEQKASTDYDLVVVGGGPGGSSLASLVAMQGYRVLQLEKEKFPRYQIGESLLPSTVHGICRLLGVTEELEKAAFPRKNGGTFRWGTNPEPWTFSFSISPQLASSTSFAYQVERMKFDQILLENSRRVGVDVREEAQALEAVEDDTGRVCGLRYVDADGNHHTVSATYVADASGNRSRIYKHVGGTRKYSEFFRNLALFGYFEGGKRLPAPYSGNILCAAFADGWFWYIPLSDELTSVGAVVNRSEADKIRAGADETSEEPLMRLIEECPLIADYLADARRVTSGPYGEIRVRKDYSYCNTSFWKPGMVLVGDAACFIDPIFSSGVHLATYSALLAARSINSCLAGTLPEDKVFGEFEARYRREFGLFYEFLTAFYDMHRDESSYFWKARKVTQVGLTDHEAFVELVGGVVSGETALANAAAVASSMASASEQLAQSVGEGGAGEGESMSFMTTPSMHGAMHEGARIQAHAVRGESLIEEKPLIPDGLVPSADGLHWAMPSGLSVG